MVQAHQGMVMQITTHMLTLLAKKLLYALHRDEPVAKGIVISVNPSTMHAGHALGRKYCEVVIRFVMKRDAKLPRPYPGVQEMADAKDLSIAWPYNRIKKCKPKKPSHGTGSGKK
ncbi:uncharacterized protein LOC8070082 [Sorghum bicolor]|uniref:uncharacterized protein LOC8070082 n=1 Tax=Sorghum bicolor TaxID=4558 RepID=UPI000B423EE4|nr:uncharacterized protein LOC8070082 [Sorghum bicolor]|eukprot:XP_021319866.1 uncharacterized protein LOC8070082 [Sorghum bicolor]